jgi:hypothetical protein
MQEILRQKGYLYEAEYRPNILFFSKRSLLILTNFDSA